MDKIYFGSDILRQNEVEDVLLKAEATGEPFTVNNTIDFWGDDAEGSVRSIKYFAETNKYCIESVGKDPCFVEKEDIKEYLDWIWRISQEFWVK